MDYNLLIKAGFMGFAASVGAISLTFVVAGYLLQIHRKSFSRVYLLASVVSFATVYALLHFKIRAVGLDSPQIYLTGVVGGWLASLVFSVTQFKNFLRNLLQI
jgi:archaellum component FlaF (FlaF/FlaG flagellin family)